MRYSLLRIANSYVREFNLFCEYVKIYSKDEKYSLLAYSLKTIYELDCCEFCNSIYMYGEACIRRLKSLDDMPDVKRLNFSDKNKILNISLSLYVLQQELEENFNEN